MGPVKRCAAALLLGVVDCTYHPCKALPYLHYITQLSFFVVCTYVCCVVTPFFIFYLFYLQVDRASGGAGIFPALAAFGVRKKAAFGVPKQEFLDVRRLALSLLKIIKIIKIRIIRYFFFFCGVSVLHTTVPSCYL